MEMPGVEPGLPQRSDVRAYSAGDPFIPLIARLTVYTLHESSRQVKEGQR